MYQNGKQLNHHAAQIRHKRNIKKRNYPPGYNSIEDFFADYAWINPDEYKWFAEEPHHLMFSVNSSDLKRTEHRAQRNFIRKLLYEIMTVSNADDIELGNTQHVIDIWDFE